MLRHAGSRKPASFTPVHATSVTSLASHVSVSAQPRPEYANAEVEVLSERLEDARLRKEKLREAGLPTDHVDHEILNLRRRLREGGQLRAGDTLREDRYLLVCDVGRGGFAVVWKAYDRVAQDYVAIKVLHSNLAGDPLRRERFFRGARVMMELRHPAVVHVLDSKGEDGGFCYFVMEYVSGGNLREAVLNNKLKQEDLWKDIFLVGSAVALAHSRGLIHRDIKPSNILLDASGAPKLTDFDLVGARDTTGGTRTGALGTVVYAAPECLDKPQEATPRADVYSLGMTAIFCLAGRDLSLSTFRNPEQTIEELCCSETVMNVLRRAVAWLPESRFSDAHEMVADLASALEKRSADQHGSGMGHEVMPTAPRAKGLRHWRVFSLNRIGIVTGMISIIVGAALLLPYSDCSKSDSTGALASATLPVMTIDRAWSQRVGRSEVPADANNEHPVALAQLDAAASVSLRHSSVSDCYIVVLSDPSDANVVIPPTRVVGKTPYRIALPCGGPVRIEVQKRALVPAVRMVTPTPEGTQVYVVLSPKIEAIRTSIPTPPFEPRMVRSAKHNKQEGYRSYPPAPAERCDPFADQNGSECLRIRQHDEMLTRAVKRKIERYANVVYPLWAAEHPDKVCPERLIDLNDYVDYNDTDMNDPWGYPLKMMCGTSLPPGATTGVAVLSVGADGEEGTDDDIKSWE